VDAIARRAPAGAEEPSSDRNARVQFLRSAKGFVVIRRDIDLSPLRGSRPGDGRWPTADAVGYYLCAEHVRQLEGESPFDNLMEVKS